MSKSIKKLIPYLLILIILVGVFSPLITQAQGDYNNITTPSTSYVLTPEQAKIQADANIEAQNRRAAQDLAAQRSNGNQTPFEQEASSVCGITNLLPGCLVKLFYYLFYALPSFLLMVSAYIFNFFISITLYTTLYKNNDFITNSWGIVRDLSNIFFILILLYVAIQTILGIGHETKKIIVRVIIVALLINFSMFFTKIVIDSSNILALIFYNKIAIEAPASNNSTARPYISVSGERDVAGGLVVSFNPTRTLDGNFFEKSKEIWIDGKYKGKGNNEVPASIMIALIFITGVIMSLAIYAFFVASFSFVGRLIELWILIIFAPFAFISSIIPKMSGMEYLGWDAWLHRLIKTAFMAPIFMFFLYLIAKLASAGIFNETIKQTAESGFIGTILSVIIPALVIMALLLKATEFAKKGGGKFGEMAISGAKLAAGLALGGAALGTAVAGRTVIGGTAAALSRREEAIKYGKDSFKHKQDLEKWEHEGKKKGEAKPTAPTPPANLLDRLGAAINKKQWISGESAHARHEMDELKEKLGLGGLADYQLSGVDHARMESTFVKDKRSDIESELRKGYDAKGKEVIIEKDVNGNDIKAKGENDYKSKRRQAIIDEVKGSDPHLKNSAGDLNDQGQKKVEDILNKEFNELLRGLAQTIGVKKFEHMQAEAKEKMGVGTRLLAKSTSSSYDPRNLANIQADKKGGLGAKATVGLISAVALGMRLGFKKGAGLEYGTPQRNFIKDIGDTISSALKNVKINVSTSDGGSHGGGGDSHGTSGGGHH